MTGASQHQDQPIGNETPHVPNYEPRFQRSKWTHVGEQFDRFFDSFVPRQYDQGFGWRCQVLGQIDPVEGQRFKEFESLSPHHKVIAANAEVLLVMFENMPPETLDQMREAGKAVVLQGVMHPSEEINGDIPALRAEQSRKHHAAWLEQFNASIAAGTRQDTNHRGAVPFDELPRIELLISKFQTLGNWRILASLSDHEYSMIRELAVKRQQSA
jgi:hypothetical protein